MEKKSAFDYGMDACTRWAVVSYEAATGLKSQFNVNIDTSTTQQYEMFTHRSHCTYEYDRNRIVWASAVM